MTSTAQSGRCAMLFWIGVYGVETAATATWSIAPQTLPPCYAGAGVMHAAVSIGCQTAGFGLRPDVGFAGRLAV